MIRFFISLLLTCLLRGIGVVYSLFLLLAMLVDTVRFGAKVWSKKNRRKNSPPSLYKSWTLFEQDTASTIIWKHCYLETKEVKFHYVASGKIPEHLKINVIDGETTVIGKNTSAQPKLLLCLHGFPESWFSWRYVLKNFDDNPCVNKNNGDTTSYFVVAIDMRGYGSSDQPRGIASYHTSKLAADIQMVIQNLGYEKCTILAHDWGGIVAWHVAEYFPEIIDRLMILNCPHPQAGVDFAVQSLKQLLINSWYMYVFMIPLFPEIYISFNDYKFIDMVMTSEAAGIQSKQHALGAEELELIKYTLEGETLTSAINYYRALLLPFYQPKQESLPKQETVNAKFPVLLLWGDKDAFMNSKMAEMTKAHLPPSDPPSRLVMFDGASHWLQQDQPYKVIKTIREFLSE